MASFWWIPLFFGNSIVLGKAIVPTSSDETQAQVTDFSLILSASSSLISHTTSLSSSTGSSYPAVGDYVAHGLALDHTSSQSSSASKGLGEDTSSTTQSGASSNSSTTTSTIFVTIGTSIASAEAPWKANSANTTKSDQNDHSSAATNIDNLTYTGACWDQWTEYWSYSAANIGSFMSDVVSTETTLYPELEKTLEFGTYTLTDTYTYYSTALEGAFPTSTHTMIQTETDTITANSGVTFSITKTAASASGETLVTATGFAQKGPVTPPACVLSSIVPQCQSMWNAWVNESFPGVLPYACSNTESGPCSAEKSTFTKHFSSYVAAAPVLSYAELLGPTPLCSQASVAADGCRNLVKNLLTNSDSGVRQTFDTFPSDSVLAPGCTVGCQTCAITGNSVQLYYWPPMTATAASQFTEIQPTITAGPKSVTQVSMFNGTYFTFTSPTLYISYEMLYASDSCSGIGPTFRNTIVPLTDNTQLSSLMAFLGDGDFPGTFYSTVPFNLTDLVQTPVPVSVYNKDPKCASSSGYTGYWGSLDGFSQEPFSCRQTAPYAPIIAVPDQVKKLDPAWKHCTAWYGGLYDPPQALTEAAAEAMPTLPGSNAGNPGNSPASPSSPGESPAPATLKPEASNPTPTEEPISEAATNQPVPNQPPETHAEASPTQPSAQTQQEPSPTTPDNTVDPDGIVASPTVGDTRPAQAASLVSNPTEIQPVKSQSQPGQDSEANSDSPSPQPTNPEQAQVLTAGGSVLSIVQNHNPSASGEAILNGQTLSQGQVATIAGQAVSAGSGGVVVGGLKTVAPVSDPEVQDADPSVVVAGSSSFTVAQGGSSHVLVAQGGSTATLARGSMTVFGGQTISAGPSSGMLVGSITVEATNEATRESESAVVTVTGEDGAGLTIAQEGSSYVAVQGSSTFTIPPGSQATLDQHTLSAPASGNGFVADGSTVLMATSNSITSIVTFDGKMMTVQAEDGVVDGVTLTNGGEIKTVDGIEMSRGSHGLVMGADGSTTTIPLSTGSSTDTTSTNPDSASRTTAWSSSTSLGPSQSSSNGIGRVDSGWMSFVVLLIMMAYGLH